MLSLMHIIRGVSLHALIADLFLSKRRPLTAQRETTSAVCVYSACKAPPLHPLNSQSEHRGILKLATRRRRGQCDGPHADETDIRDTHRDTHTHEPCSSRTTWRYLSILHFPHTR